MVWKKTPDVGTMRQFKEADDYNKDTHPIQYFFKEKSIEI